MKISELKKLLRKNGCRYIKQLNGHEDWYSPITNRHFTVPRHDSKEIGKGLEKAIKGQAGIE